VSSRKNLRKNIYTEGAESTEVTEKREEGTRRSGNTTRAWRYIEERFLSAQADRFAGANRFRKIGLLRSE
jgi:hypothetical protein